MIGLTILRTGIRDALMGISQPVDKQASGYSGPRHVSDGDIQVVFDGSQGGFPARETRVEEVVEPNGNPVDFEVFALTEAEEGILRNYAVMFDNGGLDSESDFTIYLAYPNGVELPVVHAGALEMEGGGLNQFSMSTGRLFRAGTGDPFGGQQLNWPANIRIPPGTSLNIAASFSAASYRTRIQYQLDVVPKGVYLAL